jgi:hypothetical protein
MKLPFSTMSAETEIANLLYRSVIQQTDDFPLQVIVTGRYHDQFQLVDGRWRYAFGDYSLIDMIGDVSHHLNRPIAEIGGTA